MRIVVVHNLPPGGARRRLLEQTSRLSADLIEVCLATAAPVTDSPVVVHCAPRAPRAARLVRPPLRYADLVATLRAWRRVDAVVARLGPDVVYANSCQVVQAPPVLLRSPARSLYYCEQIRRVDYESHVARSRNPRTRALYWPLYVGERRLDAAGTRRATSVATNSRFTAGEIERIYGRRPAVIPPGVSPAFLRDESRPPGRHLLSVGMLIREKGHDVAVRAAFLASVRRPLLIASPRPNEREAGRLRSLAGELGVELELRVGLDDRELADAYRTAQATIYMAEREPLGLVSLEAQACGSPVVVAAEGGLPETLLEGRTGWAVARDPGVVAACLDRLERPEVRQAFSQAAVAHARQVTWERSANQLELALRALCAGAPA